MNELVDLLVAAMSDAAVSKKMTQMQATIDPDGTGVRVVRIIVVPEKMDFEMPFVAGKFLKAFRDIAGKPEDDRIRELANACRARPGQRVAFVVDDDSVEPGKADRYVKKLRNLCPEIQELNRLPGPVAGATSVVVTFPDAR